MMPYLVAHSDERIRRFAAAEISTHDSSVTLESAVQQLADPRVDGAAEIKRITKAIRRSRLAEVVNRAFTERQATLLPWAIDQVEVIVELEDVRDALLEIQRQHHLPEAVQIALVQLAQRSDFGSSEWLTEQMSDVSSAVQSEAIAAFYHRNLGPLSEVVIDGLVRCSDSSVRAAVVPIVGRQQIDSQLEQLAHDSNRCVRLAVAGAIRTRTDSVAVKIRRKLQSDSHPFVRAESLDEAAAKTILENPDQEFSWHVLKAACRILKRPYWDLSLIHI